MRHTLLSELQERAEDPNNPNQGIAKILDVLAAELINDASNHLTQVAAQHPGFDIHDEKHSAAVMRNMEELLGTEGIAARSVFELFLLATTAYLHDCAMALPQWELSLLKLTEGVGEQGAKPSPPGIHHDLKPKLSFELARQFVRTKIQELCGSFDEVMQWRFSPKDEQSFVDDLAERLRDYQEFRNGFAAELRELVLTPDKFVTRSDELRQEFIRITHWRRVEQWSRNLDRLFHDRLGGQWGKALAHDLGTICRSHGETDSHVRALPDKVSHYGSSLSNLCLVSMLLRLADIIHFTPDRAPMILYREKMIASPVSRQHWEVKNEGISYAIENDAHGGRVVRYAAYFQVPSLYFLFQEYLDWIDHELKLYNEIYHQEAVIAQGKLPVLAPQVDRSSIRYDDRRFQPVTGLRFTLNQKRVLDLLMGVQLYKNKFACLRELYQNSLDACRCAMAASGSANPTAVIEFGLGMDNESKARYLYCLDTGIGMTKDIVSRFLLQIGNSFYKSSEFHQLATSWNTPFTPTSQFGIGILSCFMIGNRMEIVSKPMPGVKRDGTPICFLIDGPHEHFYYREPSALDLELIGPNGTLVKVYLSDTEACKVHDSPDVDFPFMRHLDPFSQNWTGFKDAWQRWEHHLYRHVSAFVAQCATGVSTRIRLSDDRRVNLLRATAPFDHRSLGVSRDDMQRVADQQRQFSRNDEPYDYLDVIDHVQTTELEVEHQGVRFSTVITLPKAGFALPPKALRKVSAVSMAEGILVDGVKVSNASIPFAMKKAEYLEKGGVINFTGGIRPALSVDRTNVVKWPEELGAISAELAEKFVIKLIEAVRAHAAAENLKPDSAELGVAWEYVLSLFGYLSGTLIKHLVRQSESTVSLAELGKITLQPFGISDFAAVPSFMLVAHDFHALRQCTKLLLLGKLTAAVVIRFDSKCVSVEGTGFASLAYQDGWDHLHYSQYVFRADDWSGSLADFDLVSSAWPVIPARLFDQLDDPYAGKQMINKRTKKYELISNSVLAISKIDPRLIHARLGIYDIEDRAFHRSAESSVVHRFERARNNFWLWELQQSSSPEAADKLRYILCAFIAPRPLSPDDLSTLDRYRTEDPDYVRGVEQGWSILFLGEKDVNNVCRPGIVSRQELVRNVPADFWGKHSDTNFVFLDGTSVRELLINSVAEDG